MRLLPIGLTCGLIVLVSFGHQTQTYSPNSIAYSFLPDELVICFRSGGSTPPDGRFRIGAPTPSGVLLSYLHARYGIERVERIAPDLPEPGQKEMMRVPSLKEPRTPKSPEETAAILRQFGLDRSIVIRFSKPIDPVALSRELMDRHADLIEYAEPNFLVGIHREPNDPRFRTQWHLVNRGTGLSGKGDVRAAQAWDISVGSSDVVIAVIDTGIDLSHPDFAGKVIPGRDFANRDNIPEDQNGHGTAVAGVAAADTDNDLLVAGVSWLSPVLVYKVFGADGGAAVSNVASAISAAVAMAPRGVRVINLSLGICDDTAPLIQQNAIAAAGAANITVVVSAGNGCNNDGRGKNNDEQPDWPSNDAAVFAHVISVAATTRIDLLASFSNYGPKTVAVAAPGEGIITTVPSDTNLETSNGSGVASVSGTSFASPLVAGVAALIYSQFPSIHTQNVRDRLLGCVDRNPLLSDKTQSGGRINAARALERDEIAPAQITDLRATRVNGQPALTWTATGDDETQGQAMFYEIRYSVQPLTPETFARGTKLNASIFPKPAGETEQLSLEDLAQGTYYFMIRAIDNVGNCSLSNTVAVPVG